MSARAASWVHAAWLAVALAGACDDPEVPVGPPRCEPEHEHEVDRRLKLGFKALATRDPERARIEFQAVLNQEPMHPEAQLGMRILGGATPIEPAPKDGAAPTGPPVETPAAIAVAGEQRAFPVPVETGRWRFEELRALGPLRYARDGAGPQHTYYRERNVGGRAISDESALTESLDLIVLHDTHTRTARDAVVELEGSGGSTHFIIDWDGTVYQVLDLIWEANHTQLAAIDARSVSIDLVNPVDLGTKPGLPDEAEARGEHRPLSDFVRVQREEVQHWGYTEAQLTSLEALVRALGKQFPRIPMRVAAPAPIARAMVDAPDELRGILGHLHVSRRSQDPGGGFPWEAFDQAIRAP